jgi:hypothetical protein
MWSCSFLQPEFGGDIMSDDFDGFEGHVGTTAGIYAPLTSAALARRLAALGEGYRRLEEGEPFLVIRHAGAEPVVNVIMILATRPMGPIPSGLQMVTEKDFEFPVQQYAIVGNGRRSMLVRGSLVLTFNELSDPSTRAIFGRQNIYEAVFRTGSPEDRPKRILYYRKLLRMAAMIGAILPVRG